MNNVFKILVMYAGEYSIQDESSGRVNEGCTIQYYFYGDHGEALTVQQKGTTGAIGYQRAKCSTNKDIRAKFTALPALADAAFEMSVGSDGKAVQKIVDIDNIVPVDFTRLAVPATKAAATASQTAK